MHSSRVVCIFVCASVIILHCWLDVGSLFLFLFLSRTHHIQTLSANNPPTQPPSRIKAGPSGPTKSLGYLRSATNNWHILGRLVICVVSRVHEQSVAFPGAGTNDQCPPPKASGQGRRNMHHVKCIFWSHSEHLWSCRWTSDALYFDPGATRAAVLQYTFM